LPRRPLPCPFSHLGCKVEFHDIPPLTRITHERFCCNRPFAAATSLPGI
jgi:hypothetical protein